MTMSPISRRGALAALGVTALARPSLAQASWPTQPIRALVTFAPGGAIDVVARLIAPSMSNFLGQQVVVDNRAGAIGTIAARAVATAAPDGHTILLDASSHSAAPHLIRNLPFSYATAFEPVTQLTAVPMIVVTHPSFPARDLNEFITLSRARAAAGQPLAYGSSGNGTAVHYATVLFLQQAGIEATHVPFRGGGPAVQALLSQSIQFHLGTTASSTALIRDGRLKALAVTSRDPVPQLPNVPTLDKSGLPGFHAVEWGAIFAPAGTPAPILDRLNAAARHALEQPAVRERLDTIGMTPVGSSREDFARFVVEQREVFGRLTVQGNVSVD